MNYKNWLKFKSRRLGNRIGALLIMQNKNPGHGGAYKKGWWLQLIPCRALKCSSSLPLLSESSA